MRRILICTGVLGSGTALVFAAAAVAATLLPGGTVVPRSQVMWEQLAKPGIAVPMPMVEPGIVVDDVGGGIEPPVGIDVPVEDLGGDGGIDLPEQGPLAPVAG